MLIIDPDREGCTVWSGAYVCNLRGTVEECCEKIIKYATFEKEVFGVLERIQWIKINLDTAGIGIAFARYLFEQEIVFTEIKPIQFL